jgi:dihydrodipicolinate synthase/N-acetylneuraminate lyase
MKVGGYDLQNIIPLAMLNSEAFQVLGAGGGNHLSHLALGVMCCTMSSASSFPKQHVEVQTLWEQGRIDEAREKAFAINRLLRDIPRGQNAESSAEEKAVLELLGICERWVYPPFKPVSDDAMTRLRAVLEAHGILKEAGATEEDKT